MKRKNVYLSTIADDAPRLAQTYQLGLELAEFCTAWNMDEKFAEADPLVRQKLQQATGVVLHAPYNELFPCAIDPRARQLAADRYRQAIGLARRYGAQKVVIHGGYHPRIYFPVWYVEQSILFWRTFLQEDPGVTLVLENVLEEEPDWLDQIVRGVDDPRLRLCLDIGHVNTYSPHSAMEWLTQWSPYISHFHLHNNDGHWDYHRDLGEGTIPMEEFLARAEALCPDATYTLEIPQSAEVSVRWLADRHLI